MPLLLIFVLSIVSAVLIVPRMDFDSMLREAYAKNPNLAEKDIDQMVRFGSVAAKGFAYASPLLAVGILALVAVLLLAAFRLMGGQGTFKQYWSVTLYAWMPQLIKSIATLAIVLSRGEVRPDHMPTVLMSHLGALVDQTEQPVLFAILSSVELFNIWTIALLVIGLAYVAKVTRAKAATIVIVLYLVVALFKIGGAAMQSMRPKA